MRNLASHALQRVRIALGLLRIDMVERLGRTNSPRLRRAARRLGRSSQESEITPLVRWKKVADTSFRSYTRYPNTARLQRLIDLLPPAARILDVGIGYAYATGVVLRDARPSYYCGIDLKENYLAAVRDMAAHNGLDLSHTSLEVRNIFHIDSEFVQRHAPDYVLILEVLEHVDDPLEALESLARNLDPGTTIIFTVPLRGKLDGIWGHRSAFGRKRIHQICHTAGLSIQHVEPIASTWVLVISRVVDHRLPWRRTAAAPGASDPSNTFADIDIVHGVEIAATGDDQAAVTLAPLDSKVRCSVRSSRPRSSGGLRIPVLDPEVVRIQVSVEKPGDISGFCARETDAMGRVLHEWHTRDVSEMGGRKPRTYVLRPGIDSRELKAVGRSRRGRVSSLELLLEPGKGEAHFTVHRIAYLH